MFSCTGFIETKGAYHSWFPGSSSPAVELQRPTSRVQFSPRLKETYKAVLLDACMNHKIIYMIQSKWIHGFIAKTSAWAHIKSTVFLLVVPKVINQVARLDKAAHSLTG